MSCPCAQTSIWHAEAKETMLIGGPNHVIRALGSLAEAIDQRSNVVR